MNNYEAQIGLKVEAVEGTEETLTAAEFQGNRKDSSHKHTHQQYERALERGTLTELEALHSMFGGGLSFTEEWVGGTSTVEAPVGATLKALGFVRAALEKWATTGMSGTFKIGDRIGVGASEPVATKKAIVAYVSGSTLWFFPTLGTFAAADLLTNFSRTGSATLSGTASAGGHAYSPKTEKAGSLPHSVTGERRLGTQRHTYVGARGTGGLTLKQGEPLLVRAEIVGPPVYQTGTRTPREAAAVTGITALLNPPKVAMGVAFFLRDGASDYVPIMTELDIDIANTLAPRPTITTAELQSSGYMATRITGRQITARIDPEHVLPTGAFDFIGKIQTGAVFEMVAGLGLHTDPNGAITIYGQRVKLDGDYEPGERDNVTTSPVTVKFAGIDDDELRLFHVFN